MGCISFRIAKSAPRAMSMDISQPGQGHYSFETDLPLHVVWSAHWTGRVYSITDTSYEIGCFVSSSESLGIAESSASSLTRSVPHCATNIVIQWLWTLQFWELMTASKLLMTICSRPPDLTSPRPRNISCFAKWIADGLLNLLTSSYEQHTSYSCSYVIRKTPSALCYGYCRLII